MSERAVKGRLQVRGQGQGQGDDDRRRVVTEFGTRLAVVKGYVQLLNRHIDRDDISRSQLVRYARTLDQHLVLLEAAARGLIGDVGGDAIPDESIVLHRDDFDDSSSSAAS
jgi:hypothetical protein